MTFDWIANPSLIYPMFRTREDERNGGYRDFGDEVIAGEGCGVSFMPGVHGPVDKPWSTHVSWSFDWPGVFADKELAKQAVEAALLRKQLRKAR